MSTRALLVGSEEKKKEKKGKKLERRESVTW